MSNTSDSSRLGRAKTSSLVRATLEDRMLDDTALNAVTGGTSNAALRLYQAACKGTHIPEVVIEL